MSLSGQAVEKYGGERGAQEKKRAQQEALRYVLAESDEPMGFCWVAEVLEVDKAWLKEKLLTDLQFFVSQRDAAALKTDIWITNLKQG